MRSHKRQYQLQMPFDLVKAGFIGGVTSFAFRFPFETFANRARNYPNPICEENVQHTFRNFQDAISPNYHYKNFPFLIRSLFNMGFLLGFFHRVCEGIITLPLQKTLKNQWIETHNITSAHNIILINAITGYIASLAELLFLHPVDNLKITIQTNPKAFDHHSVIPYFIKNQRQLRRGSMLFVTRNTALTPVCWAVKSTTEITLSETTLSKSTQQFLAAFIFALTMNLLGCPFETMRSQLLFLNKNNAEKNLLHSTKQSVTLMRQFISKHGVHALWRGFGMSTVASMTARIAQLYAFERLSTSTTEEHIHEKPKIR